MKKHVSVCLAAICLSASLLFWASEMSPLNAQSRSSERLERVVSNSSKKLQDSLLNAPAAPISLSAFGVAVTENFDTLSNTAGSTTNSLTLPGWEIAESGTATRVNGQYAVDTGGSATGDTFSYGSSGSTDRALGGLQTTTFIPTFGASFQNNTGATINSLLIAYTGEEWRLGGVGRGTDRLDFQYSLDATSLTTGTWIDVDSLDFAAPFLTSSGLRDGNAPENRTAISNNIGGINLANGSTIWIRWTDFNVTNSDDGLAVDDFSITPLVPTAAPASIAGRVTTADGYGLRNAIVTVQGIDVTSTQTVVTGTFGYYRVEGLNSGQTYAVSVNARRYTFSSPTRIVNLTENVSSLDFIAAP